VSEEPFFLPSARRPKPGRPKKPESGHVPGTPDAGGLDSQGQNNGTPAREASAPLPPRLLDVHRLAEYLSMPEATVYDLAARGVLRRVRVPLPNGGELRKLLFDLKDVDALISAWKA
jgi:hypothetical protein